MAAVEFTQVVSRGCGMDIHKEVANAVLGGVVSELGGGKFANGAMTAAYTMMFNDLEMMIMDVQTKKCLSQL